MNLCCAQMYIRKRENNNNIKFYGNYSLHKNRIVQSRSIQEVIQIIDTREVELKYVEKKFEYKKDFIDIEARNMFQTSKVMASIVKCTHRYNHYRLRDAMINNNIVDTYCLRCNQIEI